MKKSIVSLALVLTILSYSSYSQSLSLNPGSTVTIQHNQSDQLDAITLLDGSGSQWNDIVDNFCSSGTGQLSYTVNWVSGSKTALYVRISSNILNCNNSNNSFSWSGFSYDPRLFYTWTNGQGGVFTLTAFYTCPGSSPTTLCSTNITVSDQYPTGGGTINQSNYCSFQLAPTTFIPSYSNGYQYNGVDDFNFGTIQNVTAQTLNGAGGPYNPAPGPNATTFSYNISNGWRYAYTSTINKVRVLPPYPVHGVHAAYSSTSVMSAIGSSGNSCVPSSASLNLKVEYPAITYIPTDQTYVSFAQWLSWLRAPDVLIKPVDPNSNPNPSPYDLNGMDAIHLQSNLDCEHPELVSIDWYVIDQDGNEKLVAENTDGVDAKIAGKYKAKLNLNHGGTVSSEADALEDYSTAKYYIAESDAVQIYNSSSSTPVIANMNIFPNPACKSLSFSYLVAGNAEKATYIITNAGDGSIVKTDQLFVDQQNLDMDVSNLTNGTYVLSILLNDIPSGSLPFVVSCQ
jgi:hypothetical protein